METKESVDRLKERRRFQALAEAPEKGSVRNLLWEWEGA